MDFDLIKELWKETNNPPVSATSRKEIIMLLQKSSQGPVTKMKRNVVIETLIMIVLFTTTGLYFLIAFKGAYKEVTWMYLFLMGLGLFYYYRKWSLLHKMQCMTCQVKSNLQLQVIMLEKYIRLYLWAGTAFIPLIIVFLALLFRHKFPESHLWFFPSWSGRLTTSFIDWLSQILVLTVAMFFINRWYINKLYRQHIQQLKRILEQTKV